MTNWEAKDDPAHPLKNGKWVEVIVKIRENATGEVRECLSHEILERGNDYPSSYIWEDGNFSCNCNRSLFFGRAGGEEEPMEADCGDGLYSVQLRNKKTGEVYYDELEAKLNKEQA